MAVEDVDRVAKLERQTFARPWSHAIIHEIGNPRKIGLYVTLRGEVVGYTVRGSFGADS